MAEADACTGRGQLRALLRREGIYGSHLTNWRAHFDREGAFGLESKRPGPKPIQDDKDRVIEQLEREKAKAEKELRICRKLLELQIKAYEILGLALPRIEDTIEDDSSSSSDSVTPRCL